MGSRSPKGDFLMPKRGVHFSKGAAPLFVFLFFFLYLLGVDKLFEKMNFM